MHYSAHTLSQVVVMHLPRVGLVQMLLARPVRLLCPWTQGLLCSALTGFVQEELCILKPVSKRDREVGGDFVVCRIYIFPYCTYKQEEISD